MSKHLKPYGDLASILAKEGRLRAAINIGNAALAQRSDRTGDIGGVSPSLAKELARRIGSELELVVYSSAGQIIQAADFNEWDIAFLASDPGRVDRLAFSLPYVIIEATYLVRSGSGLRAIEHIDQPGNRVCVTQNAAYDHVLTRQLKNAEIVRAPTPAETLDLFLREGFEAAAGIRQPLRTFAASQKGLEVLPGHFAVIEQAIAVAASRQSCTTALNDFVREMLASGFVREALEASGQVDVAVADGA